MGNVNEVTVPLDAAGVPRAPDPNVVTPTFDAASVRLIIHVDAAGHASLLKHVAILARKADVLKNESDLALVTDERLYGAFPPQPATRISSVMFDFGDAKATAAVNQVIERAATAAATAAASSGATQTTVSAAARQAALPVVAQADAAQAFTAFLQGNLDKAKVLAIANGGSSTATMAAAEALRDGSFYQDQRGVEMIQAITAALAALPVSATTAQRGNVALNTASAFVETDLGYDRFLAGQLFGDMIAAAADQAATTAGGLALKPITAFQPSGGGTTVAAVSTAHGLVTGNEVAIQGAAVAAYNGLHTVTRMDDNTFRIAVTPVTGGPITGFAGSSNVAPLQVTSVAHGLATGDRVLISGSGKADYNGEFTVTVVDANSFSIPLVFDAATGNPAVKGTWLPPGGGQWRNTAPVRTAVASVAKVVETLGQAQSGAITAYGDTRASDAAAAVLNAIIQAASIADSPLTAQVAVAAAQAGRDALASIVIRYPRPSTVPSTDYSDFVRAADFAASVTTAANAAATAALTEKTDLLATPVSIRDKALAAAIEALSPVFSAASRSLLAELPLSGPFGSEGGGLAGEIVLPANHPTNPFRHRRHPDHTTGFDIRRLIHLTFQAQDDQATGRAGYGVDRIAGTYDEEIFGLHKPLGPSKDIGLKVRGKFQLNRISLIDTLNGR